MNNKKEENRGFSYCNFLIKNHKGLSTIVVTLIIVLLSMVAIGLVWYVVNNLIQSSTEGVETSAKCLNVNIAVKSAVCVNGTTNQTCNVTLSRTGTEDEELGGVKIIFADSVAEVTSSSLIDVPGNILQLVGKKISVNSLIANVNTIDLLEVTPYFTDDSGNQQLCSQTTSFEF
ncbi:hypothetical protein M0R72_04055 [Candidatus Pacearchaeota archaeon]|jgi:uncharacterized membrane protein|nr:hypothetical protein [Candidatus Pacearchaeota archaeon]